MELRLGSGRGGILYIHLQLLVNKLIIKIQISRNTKLGFGIVDTV